MSVRGSNINYTKYKEQSIYKHLVIVRDNIYNKLSTLLNNNIWNLKEQFEELKEFNEELNKNDPISWLNDIQHLDYPKNKVPKMNNVSLTAFQKGEYKNKYTLNKIDNKVNTESKYASRLIFFTKNFPSFKQYTKNDNIEWIVHQNRLLIYEIMTYHNTQKNTLATLLQDFKAVLRASILLLGDTAELKYKISVLSNDLKLIEEFKEQTNKVQSRSEVNTFVPYEQLLDIVDGLEEQYEKELNKLPKDIKKNGLKHPKELFNIHQDLLTVALYVLDYPSRNEKLDMKFILNDDDAEEGAFLNIANRNCKFIFNNDKKKHQPISYTLTSTAIKGLNNRLCKLLKYSYKTYPRPYVFISRTGWISNLNKISPETVSGWLKDLLPNKNIGINGLRSAFVSYYWNKMNNRQKQILINRMRTSKKEIETNYLKQYSDTDTLAKVKVEPSEDLISKTTIATDKQTAWEVEDDGVKSAKTKTKSNININKPTVKPVQSTYKKKKQTFKEWYSIPENAELHKKRMRENNNKIDVVARRYVRELNDGKLDYNKMLKSTKDKYKLKLKHGLYYSELIK